MDKVIKVSCPSCGAPLELPGHLEKAYCVYCGSMVIVEREAKPAPGPSINTLLELGHSALEGHNYTEAYEYFSRALELNPSEIRGWVGKGIAALYADYKLGLGLQAKTCFRQALQLDPENVDALIYLGKIEAMVAYLEKALKLDPTRRDQVLRELSNIGQAKFKLLPDACVKALELLYQLDPSKRDEVAEGLFDVALGHEERSKGLGWGTQSRVVIRDKELFQRALNLASPWRDFVHRGWVDRLIRFGRLTNHLPGHSTKTPLLWRDSHLVVIWRVSPKCFAF